MTATPIPFANPITFEVLDAATGTLLSETGASTAGSFTQGTTFTVPASGSLKIRVGRVTGTLVSRAPYQFFFVELR